MYTRHPRYRVIQCEPIGSVSGNMTMKIFLNSLPRVIVNIATTVEFSEFGKSLGSAQTERVQVTDGFHLAALSNPSSQPVIRVTQEIRSNKTLNLLFNQTRSMRLFVRLFKKI